jgi:hypothetical protein
VRQLGPRRPRASQLGSELDAEVERLDALPLPQLAAEVMAKAFRSDYEPGADPAEIGGIADEIMPAHSPAKYGDEVTDSQLRLRDLIAEGVQLLEQARLVRLEAHYSGQAFYVGYVTTRLGRAALAGNAVDRILGGGSL